MIKLNPISAAILVAAMFASLPALAQTTDELAEKERKAKVYAEQQKKEPSQKQKMKAVPLRPGTPSEAAQGSLAQATDPAAPGEHHRQLAALAGTWSGRSKLWLEPGKPPVEGDGRSVNEMILGGRFLKSEFHGHLLGQEFLGFGLDGYDNVKGVHTGQWMDTAGTMVTHYEGGCSEDGKVITTHTEFLDPVTGQSRKMRGVTTLEGADKYSYASYDEIDGEYVKTMEVVFTRE